MSDLSIYELEDIVWDLGDNDDHLVPRIEGKKSVSSIESDVNKKPRLEPRCTVSNADSKRALDNVLQEGDGTKFDSLRKEKMLNKRPWTHLSSGSFSHSLDEDSSRKSLCSMNDERTFDQCMGNSNIGPGVDGLCADDPILGDQAASLNDSLYQYHFDNATPTESDLGFLGSSLDDKEGNDLAYYGWTDLENFEDIDRMFRSCDSTFGLNVDNNDELGWFPSSYAIEGSNDEAKPSIKFSGSSTSGLESATAQQEVFKFNTNGLITDESDKKVAPVHSKRSQQKSSSTDSSTVMNVCDVNGPGVCSSIDAKSQIPSYTSELQLQSSSEGIKKELTSENGPSFIQYNNLKHVDESGQPSKFQCSLSSGNQQQEASHSTCVQMSVPKSNTNSHCSSQVQPSMTSSIIKPEHSGLPSTSPTTSSYESNHKPQIFRNKRKHRRKISAHLGKGSLLFQRRDYDPNCTQKDSKYEYEVDGHSEVDGDVGTVTELDSPNIQESSCVSSILDEVSIDASSFQQLQDVMEKLDIRTKLCIRDSLYRLSRSAERRHKCMNPTTGDNDDSDATGALLPDGTNKCTGFMDMETDTNPIDRSIAHLLFHRPSDPSASAPFDTIPMKSHPKGRDRHNGRLVAEKPSTQDETTSALNTKLEN